MTNDRTREMKRAWKKRNAEKVRASNAAYRARNKEKVKASNRRWYEANRDRAAATGQRWAKNNPDKVKAKAHKSKRSTAKIAYSLLKAAERRATQYGVPFMLTREWLSQKIAAGMCEATGHSFSHEPGSPWRPSIDRMVNKIGYVPDNCRVVACIYNFAKHSYTDADVLELARTIIERKPANG